VYLGEHYAPGVLLGWLYAVIVLVVGNRIYDRYVVRSRARRALRRDMGPPLETDGRSR
jgi:hypothetical protein